MSVQTNKETVRRFVEEVLNNQPQGTREFVAQDYINHDPTGRVMQGLTPNMVSFRAAFPDLHFTIKEILGEEDLVAVQWIVTGAHQQPIAHLSAEFARPGSGKRVTLTGASFFRFEGEKIEEVWNYWDAHHLLEQISPA
jgi:steroid delta-isomerase-like uncharacterized protein